MKKLSLSAGAVLLVVGLAGCAGAAPAPTNAPGESSSLEVTSLTVGVIPTSDTTTVYVAQDLDYFADEDLTVTMEVMQNAAAIVPGVMNGQIQFGTAAIPPILSAISEGLPLRIVANGGNVRVGLEDSLWIGPGKLATSNAQQVQAARRIIEELGFEVATPDDARRMLELKGADKVGF